MAVQPLSESVYLNTLVLCGFALLSSAVGGKVPQRLTAAARISLRLTAVHYISRKTPSTAEVFFFPRGSAISQHAL